jgi:hypothetical protein
MSAAVVRCALWANDLARLGQRVPPCREYVFVEAGPDIAPQLAIAMAVDEEHARRRLERGCRAFVWNWRAEVVSWLWVSTGEEWAPPLRRSLRFAEADCYGWSAGTQEGHRGRGLFTGLLEYAGWRMAQEGFHTMWGGILDANLASRRANARAGMRPILRLIVHHEPPPTRIYAWPADCADERLVERAHRLFGDEPPTRHRVHGHRLAAVQRIRAARVAGVGDECGGVGVRRVRCRARRASTGGRSAPSIWTGDLEGSVGARARVKLTRRSLLAVELRSVRAVQLGGEVGQVRSGAVVRLRARAGGGA